MFIKGKEKACAALGWIVIAVVIGLFFYVNQDKGKIVPVSKQELNVMFDSKQSILVYVGRPNCFDCQEFYPEFERHVQDYGIKIYYFNTEVKVSKKDAIKKYVKSMGIKKVPSILEINCGKIVTIYDGQSENDMKRFYAKYKEKNLWKN